MELEDLPGRPVRRTTAPRFGPGAIVGLVAVGVLLAGGFGWLGGRVEDAAPSASPGVAAVAPSPSGSSMRPPTAAASPVVTPWAPCSPDVDPATFPAVLLQTNGVPYPGAMSQVPGGPAPGSEDEPMPRVEIRPDVVTEIWIAGGTCAVEWHIDLFDPASRFATSLDTQRNGSRDPAVAAQNRFLLAGLPEHRELGHDLHIRAVLTLGSRVVRATWVVRILPLEAPPVTLSGASGDAIPLAWGCDVRLTLGNGWSERPDGPRCEDDLQTEPSRFRVRPGEPLTLSFPGWDVDNIVVTCGRLSGLSFVAVPAPECEHRLRSGGPFAIPESGGWVLQLSACGSQPGSGARNRLCGSWYALLEIR